MGQSELLAFLCEHLQRLRIRYFITGSHATIAFGRPRFTNDIDVVVELNPGQVELFCAGFSEDEFYLSKQAAQEAVKNCRMFNIIHPTSGLKIDVIVPQPNSFDQLRFQRAVQVPLDGGGSGYFSSPEDIIVKKLEWHKMGGGERHLEDIKGIIEIQTNSLDREYIVEQARQLDVVDIWNSIFEETD